MVLTFLTMINSTQTAGMFDSAASITFEFLKLVALGAVVLLLMIVFDDGKPPVEDENTEPRPGLFNSLFHGNKPKNE